MLINRDNVAHVVFMLLMTACACILSYYRGKMDGKFEGQSDLPTTPSGCPPYLFVNYRLRGQEVLQGMRDNTRLRSALNECRRMNRPTEMDAGVSGYPLIATELEAVTRELNACLDHAGFCDTVLQDCTNRPQVPPGPENTP